jgi:plasmid maintenance system antidote protein VapI
MARTAIHPDEHLAEELRELNISATELARQLKGAGQPDYRRP